MSEVKVSEFELKVLKAMVKNRGLSAGGNKRIAVQSALQRLGKKGLAYKGREWYATNAGEEYVKNLETA